MDDGDKMNGIADAAGTNEENAGRIQWCNFELRRWKYPRSENT